LKLALTFIAVVAAPFWAYTVLNWRRAFLGLLIFLPFSGAVSLWLYPSSLGVLLKDVLFVIPCYLGLFLFAMRHLRGARPPGAVLGAMLFLSILVLAQTANPGLASALVAAIGVKVWLFYMPLIVVAAAYLDSRERLVRLLRLLTLLAILPCLVGLLQWFLSATVGYRETIEFFYGEAARQATQKFNVFHYGGKFFRIPATFSFVSQYFAFTLAMLAPAYALMRLDPSPRWRRRALAVLLLLLVAALLSGARSAIVFTPLALCLMLVLDRRLTGLMTTVVLLPVAALLILQLGGIDPWQLLGVSGELLGAYSQDIVIGGPLEAIGRFPFGTGTGMNTGAARYAFDDGDTSRLIGLETYYGKAVVELGVPGLLAVLLLFGSIIVTGWRRMRRLRDPHLRSVAAAFLAFFIVILFNSTKGWILDNDPVNVYFWVFAGALFKLRYLDAAGRKPVPASRPRHVRSQPLGGGRTEVPRHDLDAP